MQHPYRQRALLGDAVAMAYRDQIAQLEPTVDPCKRAGEAMDDVLEHRLVGEAVLAP